MFPYIRSTHLQFAGVLQVPLYKGNVLQQLAVAGMLRLPRRSHAPPLLYSRRHAEFGPRRGGRSRGCAVCGLATGGWMNVRVGLSFWWGFLALLLIAQLLLAFGVRLRSTQGTLGMMTGCDAVGCGVV